MYEFSLRIIELIKDMPEKQIYWCFRDQLMKSGTSIGANIIEAKSASSRREFIKYYEIALKSANETKYWLCLLRDTKLIDVTEQFTQLLREAIEIANMLGAALLTLKNKHL